jgi:rhodanese-related sulfurtransferase
VKAAFKARIPTEHEDQKGFVTWFRMTYPRVRIFAIPNGGVRSKAAAGKLKAEGVSAGVPDLFVPAWGLFIEMKRLKGGVVSEEQKDWLDYLASEGYSVMVCRGIDDAIRSVKAFKGERDGQAV